VQIVFGVLYLVLWLYLMVLLARLVIDWIQSFARSYRPRGPVLLLFEIVYTLTDPPVRTLRRLIPPLRLGGMMLDLSMLILLIAGWIVLGILARLAY